MAAIDAQMPANLAPGTTIETYAQVLEGLTRQGLERSGIVCLTPEQVIDQHVPAELADDQGLSLYLPRGRELYVDAGLLDAESQLLSGALGLMAPAVCKEKAAAIAECEGLGEDQAAALIGILSSGRQVEVFIGPAGTGKSYTSSKLPKAWNRVCGRRLGTPAVTALTVSQNAAEVLRGEGFKQRRTWLAGSPSKSASPRATAIPRTRPTP